MLHLVAKSMLHTKRHITYVKILECAYAIHLSSGEIYAVKQTVSVAKHSYGEMDRKVCISNKC